MHRALLDVDPVDVRLGAALAQPVEHVTAGRRLLVLDHERADGRHCAPPAPTAPSPTPASSRSTSVGNLAHDRREARHHLGKLIVCGRERRREQTLVTGVAVAGRLRREGHEPVFERELVDPSGDAEVGWEKRRAVARVHVLDPQQVAVTPDLAHDRDARERVGQLVAQARPALGHSLHQPLALQRVDHGDADGARERRAVPRVAEREAARSRGHRLIDAVVTDRRADRRVSGSQALGGRDDVGGERELAGRKPVAGAAHAGHDLVKADQEAVALAALGKPLPEALGRHVGRQRGRADHFGKERSHVLRAGLLECRVERCERLLAGRVKAPRARRDVGLL